MYEAKQHKASISHTLSCFKKINAQKFKFTDNRKIERIIMQRHRDFEKTPHIALYSNGGKKTKEESSGNMHYHISINPIASKPKYWEEAHVTWEKYKGINYEEGRRPHMYFKELKGNGAEIIMLGRSRTAQNRAAGTARDSNLESDSKTIVEAWLKDVSNIVPHISFDELNIWENWNGCKKIKITYSHNKKKLKDDEKVSINNKVYYGTYQKETGGNQSSVTHRLTFTNPEEARICYFVIVNTKEDTSWINSEKRINITVELIR